jgi:hypothetical protein
MIGTKKSFRAEDAEVSRRTQRKSERAFHHRDGEAVRKFSSSATCTVLLLIVSPALW